MIIKFPVDVVLDIDHTNAVAKAVLEKKTLKKTIHIYTLRSPSVLQEGHNFKQN